MKAMDSRRYAIRLFLEGCVVVASILIAFLLDAWWTDRQSRHELELELGSVRLELELNRGLVSREIQSLTLITTASSTLIERMDAAGDAPSVNVPDSLAWLVTLWGPTLDASFGAVEALIGSGRLAQIESPALRAGLGGLRDVIKDAVEDEILARQIQTEQQIPMISDRLDLAPMARIDAEFFDASYDEYSLVNKEIPSYVGLDYPNDLRVRNVIQHRMSWLVSANSEMVRLREQLDALIAMLPQATQ
jgi:hypothetical protein